MKPITADILVALAKKWTPFVEPLAAGMAHTFPLAGFDTPLRAAHFLGQACYETAYFSRMTENLVYSPLRITTIWPRLADRANALAGNAEALANAAYANKNGNGDEASGDGWRFRGRGPFQLTGRANYRTAGAERDPDVVATPAFGVMTAITYWKTRDITPWADKDDTARVTELVNGGLLGLSEREDLKKIAFNLINAA